MLEDGFVRHEIRFTEGSISHAKRFEEWKRRLRFPLFLFRKRQLNSPFEKKVYVARFPRWNAHADDHFFQSNERWTDVIGGAITPSRKSEYLEFAFFALYECLNQPRYLHCLDCTREYPEGSPKIYAGHDSGVLVVALLEKEQTLMVLTAHRFGEPHHEDSKRLSLLKDRIRQGRNLRGKHHLLGVKPYDDQAWA